MLVLRLQTIYTLQSIYGLASFLHLNFSFKAICFSADSDDAKWWSSELHKKLGTVPPHDIIPYKGSLQTSLPHSFVNFILTDTKVRDYISFLKNTHIPDEFLFETVVLNPHLDGPFHFPREFIIVNFNVLCCFSRIVHTRKFRDRIYFWKYIHTWEICFWNCCSKPRSNTWYY